jgi:hypothetical protein
VPFWLLFDVAAAASRAFSGVAEPAGGCGCGWEWGLTFEEEGDEE